MTENQLTEFIIGKAIEIHREMGPGLLEKVYEIILFHELRQAGLRVERQVDVPIRYKGVIFETAYTIDLLVENCVILEIKAVEKLAPSAESQLLTYMRLKGLTVGLILNFSQLTMREGIHRVVNGLIEIDQFPDRASVPSLY